MTVLDEQQFSRLVEGIDRIGSELNQLTSELSALGSCMGGIIYAVNSQTNAINDLRDKVSIQTGVIAQQGESLKDSITDLTMHVASQSVSVPANDGATT